MNKPREKQQSVSQGKNQHKWSGYSFPFNHPLQSFSFVRIINYYPLFFIFVFQFLPPTHLTQLVLTHSPENHAGF